MEDGDTKEVRALIERLGPQAIQDLHRQIDAALADEDDAEALRLDRILRVVEASLGIDRLGLSGGH